MIINPTKLASEQEPHHQKPFCVIPKIHLCINLTPLTRDKVVVFEQTGFFSLRKLPVLEKENTEFKPAELA